MYGVTLNWLAIAVAAVAAFMIGMLWYSPLLFGNAWVKAHGYNEADLLRMRDNAARAMGVAFLGGLVMAIVLAFLLGLTPIIRWQGGAKLGALCWLGFAATIGLSSNFYSEKKIATFFIDAGYQLVYMVMMGALLAWWR